MRSRFSNMQRPSGQITPECITNSSWRSRGSSGKMRQIVNWLSSRGLIRRAKLIDKGITKVRAMLLIHLPLRRRKIKGQYRPLSQTILDLMLLSQTILKTEPSLNLYHTARECARCATEIGIGHDSAG